MKEDTLRNRIEEKYPQIKKGWAWKKAKAEEYFSPRVFIKTMKKTLLQRVICSIRGHRYPIKWSKEKWPNGEEVETGMADTRQPCNRCGVFGVDIIADLEKMYWNIADDLRLIKKKLDIK